MPDLVKEIYLTLEEMQAAGGLGGGGGGATDVSTLATEVTLATVAVNTAATTTAIGQLETNVITASGVQTLSLNSATSAQTTTLGTAIGATTTAVQAGNTTLANIFSIASNLDMSMDALNLTTSGQSTTLEEMKINNPGYPLTAIQNSVVPASTVAEVLVFGSPSRRSLSIFNNSTSTLYLGFGNVALSKITAVCAIVPGGYYEMPFPVYQGDVQGFWDAANGNASIWQGV